MAINANVRTREAILESSFGDPVCRWPAAGRYSVARGGLPPNRGCACRYAASPTPPLRLRDRCGCGCLRNGGGGCARRWQRQRRSSCRLKSLRCGRLHQTGRNHQCRGHARTHARTHGLTHSHPQTHTQSLCHTRNPHLHKHTCPHARGKGGF